MGHSHPGRRAASAASEQPSLSTHIRTYFLYERTETEKKRKKDDLSNSSSSREGPLNIMEHKNESPFHSSQYYQNFRYYE